MRCVIVGQKTGPSSYGLYRSTHLHDLAAAPARYVGRLSRNRHKNHMIAGPQSELPNPFMSVTGERVRDAAQWRKRRQEIHQLAVPLAYGDLPAAPDHTRCVALHTAVVKRLGGAGLLSCRVQTDGRPAFVLRVFVPVGGGTFPAVLNGDGCWHHASDEVIAAVLERGFCFAQFNRVEIASDIAGDISMQEPSRLFPEKPCAALAAWAWGYHRAVDALLQLGFVDGGCIAVVGHSRGGKAALLAGATDERITLTSANNSGAGGAGCFRWQGPGAETLADVVNAFPHWFGPGLKRYAGREHELPFDQHFLKALVAPRALLTTEALGDLWANPQGSWQTHLAAREVYALLGAQEHIAIAFREGGHEHNLADWLALLDFCDTVFRGKPRSAALEANPFPGLPAAFGWRHESPAQRAIGH